MSLYKYLLATAACLALLSTQSCEFALAHPEPDHPDHPDHDHPKPHRPKINKRVIKKDIMDVNNVSSTDDTVVLSSRGTIHSLNKFLLNIGLNDKIDSHVAAGAGVLLGSSATVGPVTVGAGTGAGVAVGASSP